MKQNWGRREPFWKGLILQVVLFLAFGIFLFVGVGAIAYTSDEENAKVLEKAVKRAMVQCYAIEGMYPPNVKYLEDHYGLIVDHEKYAVYYDAFASNILPDVKVVDISGD